MEMFQIISFKSLHLGGNVYISIGWEGGRGGENGDNFGGFCFLKMQDKGDKKCRKGTGYKASNYNFLLFYTWNPMLLKFDSSDYFI